MRWSPALIHWAAFLIGPYKDKRQLFKFFPDQAYVSPQAQVKCLRLRLEAQALVDDYVTIYAHPGAEGEVWLGESARLYRWSTVELGRGGASVRIGANTALQAGCILNAFERNIVIGANCLIGARCVFTPYQHSIADHRPIREQPLTSRGDIVIEDDVWLGAHVSVMDGVTIGRGSVIGAGAVVTRDIPPFSIAAGVPARVIRPRFEA
jgi:acetyltransferase-like isoleucine patch superfamily enzyme